WEFESPRSHSGAGRAAVDCPTCAGYFSKDMVPQSGASPSCRRVRRRFLPYSPAMTITITPTSTEGVDRRLQVSVPAEDVRAAEDRAAKKYASSARLP